MKDKEFKRHMAYEALVILGLLALLLFITRLWPILLLVILGIFIATLRLLFLSCKTMEPTEPLLALPEAVDPPAPKEQDVQTMGYWVIQNRISQILYRQFPNARWVWENPRARQDILQGERVFILLNQAGGYRRGEVVIRNLQVMDIRDFTYSDEGRRYISVWMRNHPEYEEDDLSFYPDDEDDEY